ncbi:MAG: hypothetical protein ACFE7R_03070, partial [Candidatus Hodarchaeota archaeon]
PRLLDVLRGGEFVGNRLRYKVKVINQSELVITDVSVTLISFPRESLRLEGGSSKSLPKLEPKGFRSPTFDFLPTQDCVRGDIIASVSFVDSTGSAHSITTEPYTVRAVCDLLQPENISSSDFEMRLSQMTHGEMTSKVHDWTPDEMYTKTLQILESSNFSVVQSSISTAEGMTEGQVEGWAKGKYTGKNIGIRVLITGRSGERGASAKITMSGEDSAMILPAIDEITQKLAAWLCPMCGGKLPLQSVDELKDGKSVPCPFCGVAIDR